MKKFLYLFLIFGLGFKGKAQNLARGADIGWLSEMEQSGRIWRDSLGVQRDLLDILDDYCINSIRLRVWVNPTNGWSGKQDVINLAKRASAKGYRLMVDFHYSDSWADPGQQTKPAAWANFTVPQLEQAIYDHTVVVLSALKKENITPEWVQVGNETNDGMLWPEGRASLNNNANMVNYAKFVDKGYSAVKSVFPNAKVIVHVTNGYDNGLFRWNIGGLVANKARFDIIAMSMYPELASDWQTYSAQALTNMQDMVTRYGKEVMVSEIGLATSSQAEAKLFVEKTIRDLKTISSNKGLGVFWWEPEAYNWKGYGKVAWNSSTGTNAYRATDAMKGFKYDCALPVNKPVSVTFKVNMTGQNVSSGVYITGAMTAINGNWQIIPMVNEGNGIYNKTFQLMPSDTGAYYFLNSNAWAGREFVPSLCATSYKSDRSYFIGQKNQEIKDVWGACNQVVTANDFNVNQSFSIYPNPFKESIKIDLEEQISYKIMTLDGTIVSEDECKEQCNTGAELSAGIYILQVFSIKHSMINSYKIIKD